MCSHVLDMHRFVAHGLFPMNLWLPIFQKADVAIFLFFCWKSWTNRGIKLASIQFTPQQRISNKELKKECRLHDGPDRCMKALNVYHFPAAWSSWKAFDPPPEKEKKTWNLDKSCMICPPVNHCLFLSIGPITTNTAVYRKYGRWYVRHYRIMMVYQVATIHEWTSTS